MDKEEILFIIPTIMSRPSFEISNLEMVAKEFPNQRILFISNVEDKDFTNYNPKSKNIEKYVSGVEFSISDAINTGISKAKGEKYFCFIQSDFFINKDAIKDIKSLCDDPSLNTGVIGIRPHSTFKKFNKRIGIFYSLEVFKVLWGDGIMFCKMSIFDTVGEFDNSYRGDVESQEFCYRVHDAGFNNYIVKKASDKQSWNHKSTPFQNKAKKNSSTFLKLVDNSRKLFKKVWGDWQSKVIKDFK